LWSSITDFVGFLAGGMTVAAFGFRHMLALRCSAIAANLLFIAYGLMLGLVPILALHCLLLPLNLIRLRGCLREAAIRFR
jgi:hypothetical protein